jgi:hypothetical protein
MRILFETLCLVKQQELRQTNGIDQAGQVLPGSGQGSGFALDQLCRPLEIVGVVVSGLQRSEESVIVQQ